MSLPAMPVLLVLLALLMLICAVSAQVLPAIKLQARPGGERKFVDADGKERLFHGAHARPIRTL